MPNTTSLSLIEQLRLGGDEGRWNVFLTLYGPLVVGSLRAKGVAEQDALDIQQEVFAVVVKQLPCFQHNGRKGAFRNWLRQITANCLRNYQRKESGQPAAIGGPSFEALAAEMEDPTSDLTEHINREHHRAVVELLLAEVSSRSRKEKRGWFEESSLDAFRMTCLEGRDPQEVAATLKLSVNAVAIAKSRVLSAVRHIVENELGTEILDD